MPLQRARIQGSEVNCVAVMADVMVGSTIDGHPTQTSKEKLSQTQSYASIACGLATYGKIAFSGKEQLTMRRQYQIPKH